MTRTAMSWIRVSLLVLGLTAGLSSPAAAGFIVTVEDLTLSGGSSGSLDVWITSDSSDRLALFQAEFRITPVAPAAPLLSFSTLQPDASADSDYVFFGNSFGYLANVTTENTFNDTVIVGDNTADFSDVEFHTDAFLLARLQVEAGTPAVDSTFSIDLVPLSGDSTDFLLGTSNTGFLDSSFNPIEFTSMSGTVTVTGASTAVIPEPSSIALFCLGALGLAAARRRRSARGRSS